MRCCGWCVPSFFPQRARKKSPSCDEDLHDVPGGTAELDSLLLHSWTGYHPWLAHCVDLSDELPAHDDILREYTIASQKETAAKYGIRFASHIPFFATFIDCERRLHMCIRHAETDSILACHSALWRGRPHTAMIVLWSSRHVQERRTREGGEAFCFFFRACSVILNKTAA